VGADEKAERATELQPDRYYLLGDAGSFFFDPAGDRVPGGRCGGASIVRSERR
jgi:hypothetical protein